MTNITNEQLEAWASLGPWEWQKLAEFSSPKHSLGPGVLLTDERDGTPWGDTIDQINAAPALAAALLAERKAREVEVGRLTKVLSALDEIIESNIVGNDGPNRFWVGGVALEGPHADMIFKILRKIQKVCRQALKGPTP